MIEPHAANSAWWGGPVGLVTDPGFFALDHATRAALLGPFAWVEFKAPLAAAPPASALHGAGFAWTDVQINFRIDLRNVPDSPSLAPYECVSAAEQAFQVEPGDIRPFEHERFLQLPGATASLLADRYAGWANELVTRNPQWCLRMVHGGTTQGWFLAEPSNMSATLTLAMLTPAAVASGQHLYQRCLREFAARGAVVGHASFSVRNTPVLNIYSSLRAHFTTPSGVWTWLADKALQLK
jgi:hypothetical protein